uniref:Uncharacterized protein n=1 Tax=Arundo donax TaxID=35708 RepID=A0A0A9F0B5_ARUDO
MEASSSGYELLITMVCTNALNSAVEFSIWKYRFRYYVNANFTYCRTCTEYLFSL